MLPYRDINPTRRTPWLTWLLILLNAAMYLFTVTLAPAAESRLLWALGFVPARFMGQAAGEAFTVVTSLFVHEGLGHLVSNMLFLWVFGDNVEDHLGRRRFILFYLLAGATALLVQLMVDPTSTVPVVGASGAIAGVLGAYGLLYPRAPVRVVIPPLFFWPFELPAWVVITYWFLLQVIQGFASLSLPTGQVGVAFFAHIGGFLAGLILVRPLGLPRSGQGPLSRRVQAW